MIAMIRHFVRDRSCNVAVEYCLLAFCICGPLIIFVGILRLAIVWAYGDLETAINAGGTTVDGM